MERRIGAFWVFFAVVAMVFSAGNMWVTTINQAVPVVAYSIGSTGETIKKIQQKLVDWGYYGGDIDGIYGQGTYKAIKLFQQNNGLVSDGIVGDSTLIALGLIAETAPTETEVEILAKAIHAEARGEPYEGQVAVGAVILNRVDSSKFPNSVGGVVYQKGAFDAVRDGQINLTPNEVSLRAAKDAINGWDPTNGALYYWNPQTATSKWIWTVPITTQIGRHVFGVK